MTRRGRALFDQVKILTLVSVAWVAGGGRGCVPCPSRTTRDNCFLIQLEGIREFSVPFRETTLASPRGSSPFSPLSTYFYGTGKHRRPHSLFAWLLRIKRTKLIFPLLRNTRLLHFIIPTFIKRRMHRPIQSKFFIINS